MSNHIHLIVSAENKNLSNVLRDYKRFTATSILKSIEENKYESRREWKLNLFRHVAKSINAIVSISFGGIIITT